MSVLLHAGSLADGTELGEQLYRLAQREAAPTPLLEAHEALGNTLFYLGEYDAAWTHLEQESVLADPWHRRSPALRQTWRQG